MSARTRALLFDLDGTLLDTAPDMIAAANALRADAGMDALPLATLRPFVSKGGRAILRAAFPDLDEAAREALLQPFLGRYRADIAAATRPFDGMLDLLTLCRAQGIELGIVTNKPGWLTDAVLATLDLRREFGAVVSGDTLPVKKPDPAMLHLACARLGVAARQALMVGDSANDAFAARDAGMPVLLVRYGYSEGMPVDSIECDGLLSNALEVLDHIGPA